MRRSRSQLEAWIAQAAAFIAVHSKGSVRLERQTVHGQASCRWTLLNAGGVCAIRGWANRDAHAFAVGYLAACRVSRYSTVLDLAKLTGEMGVGDEV